MLKKHYKEILLWTIVPVLIIFILLFIVYAFEKLNIDVPGSREMWMGLIGAVLGGFFTMLGVLVTMYKQEEQNKEDKRLEYMPLLKFRIGNAQNIEKELEFDALLSCLNGELCTSGHIFLEQKKCQFIEASVLNHVALFDFTIEGCLINGKQLYNGDAFNPDLRRLVPDERYRLIFDNEDYSNTDEFCLIRFSYKDMFGHRYYQDLPIIYFEGNNYGIGQDIEIRDIKAPILVDGSEKTLEEAAKAYCDYKDLWWR